MLLITTVYTVLYIMPNCLYAHIKKYGFILTNVLTAGVHVCFLIVSVLYTGLSSCVRSLLTLVSLHRMQVASRLASYWAAVVLVWH